MDWRFTPPKRVTSPTWATPPPCKQALNWQHTGEFVPRRGGGEVQAVLELTGTLSTVWTKILNWKPFSPFVDLKANLVRHNGLCSPRNINEILEINQFIFEKLRRFNQNTHLLLIVWRWTKFVSSVTPSSAKKVINMNTMITVPHQRGLSHSA